MAAEQRPNINDNEAVSSEHQAILREAKELRDAQLHIASRCLELSKRDMELHLQFLKLTETKQSAGIQNVHTFLADPAKSPLTNIAASVGFYAEAAGEERQEAFTAKTIRDTYDTLTGHRRTAQELGQASLSSPGRSTKQELAQLREEWKRMAGNPAQHEPQTDPQDYFSLVLASCQLALKVEALSNRILHIKQSPHLAPAQKKDLYKAIWYWFKSKPESQVLNYTSGVDLVTPWLYAQIFSLFSDHTRVMEEARMLAPKNFFAREKQEKIHVAQMKGRILAVLKVVEATASQIKTATEGEFDPATDCNDDPAFRLSALQVKFEDALVKFLQDPQDKANKKGLRDALHNLGVEYFVLCDEVIPDLEKEVEKCNAEVEEAKKERDACKMGSSKRALTEKNHENARAGLVDAQRKLEVAQNSEKQSKKMLLHTLNAPTTYKGKFNHATIELFEQLLRSRLPKLKALRDKQASSPAQELVEDVSAQRRPARGYASFPDDGAREPLLSSSANSSSSSSSSASHSSASEKAARPKEVEGEGQDGEKEEAEEAKASEPPSLNLPILPTSIPGPLPSSAGMSIEEKNAKANRPYIAPRERKHRPYSTMDLARKLQENWLAREAEAGRINLSEEDQDMQWDFEEKMDRLPQEQKALSALATQLEALGPPAFSPAGARPLTLAQERKAQEEREGKIEAEMPADALIKVPDFSSHEPIFGETDAREEADDEELEASADEDGDGDRDKSKVEEKRKERKSLQERKSLPLDKESLIFAPLPEMRDGGDEEERSLDEEKIAMGVVEDRAFQGVVARIGGREAMVRGMNVAQVRLAVVQHQAHFALPHPRPQPVALQRVQGFGAQAMVAHLRQPAAQPLAAAPPHGAPAQAEQLQLQPPQAPAAQQHQAPRREKPTSRSDKRKVSRLSTLRRCLLWLGFAAMIACGTVLRLDFFDMSDIAVSNTWLHTILPGLFLAFGIFFASIIFHYESRPTPETDDFYDTFTYIAEIAAQGDDNTINLAALDAWHPNDIAKAQELIISLIGALHPDGARERIPISHQRPNLFQRYSEQLYSIYDDLTTPPAQDEQRRTLQTLDQRKRHRLVNILKYFHSRLQIDNLKPEPKPIRNALWFVFCLFATFAFFITAMVQGLTGATAPWVLSWAVLAAISSVFLARAIDATFKSGSKIKKAFAAGGMMIAFSVATLGMLTVFNRDLTNKILMSLYANNHQPTNASALKQLNKGFVYGLIGMIILGLVIFGFLANSLARPNLKAGYSNCREFVEQETYDAAERSSKLIRILTGVLAVAACIPVMMAVTQTLGAVEVAFIGLGLTLGILNNIVLARREPKPYDRFNPIELDHAGAFGAAANAHPEAVAQPVPQHRSVLSLPNFIERLFC